MLSLLETVLQDSGCDVPGTWGITEEFLRGPEGIDPIPLPSHAQQFAGSLGKIKVMNYSLLIFPSLDRKKQKSSGQ